GVGTGLLEVLRVQVPKRLHAGVEGAAGQPAVVGAFAKQPHQVGGRMRQVALPVQLCKGAVVAVQAEQAFQAMDFGQGLVQQPLGECAVGVVQAQFGVGAQGDAAPGDGVEVLGGLRPGGGVRQAQCAGRQGEGRGGGGDADEAAAGGQRGAHVGLDDQGAATGGCCEKM